MSAQNAQSGPNQAVEILATHDKSSLQQMILDAAMDGFCMVDMQGRLLEVNAAYCRINGYTKTELLAMHVSDFEAAESADETAAHIQKVMAQGEDRFETRQRRKNGSVMDVEVCAQYLPIPSQRIVCFVRDITQRKQAEQGLRESERSLREAQAIAHMGSYVLDIPTGWWTSSQVLDQVFGINERYQRTVEGWAALVHPDDRAMMLDYVKTQVIGQGVAFDREYRIIRHSDRAERWVHGRGRLEFDAQSRPVKLYGTILDITDCKRTEETLQHAKSAAEAATQMKDQFLAKLSHELRTPLTPALLAVSRWQGQPDIPALLRDDMTMVCRNLELEARLLDDLLDVNRILYGKLSLRREVLSVHQAINEAVGIVAAAAQAKRLKLTVQLHAANDRVDGDLARVQQIVWNLLSNAIKFTPEAGTITLATANHPDGQIQLQVSDTGIGMEPELLSGVFKPFEQGGQQINRQFGGMGLGLTICYSLAEAHGGSITAASEGRNKGATFTVLLPLTHVQPSSEPAAPPETAKSAKAGSLRILLVEDHADTAHMLSRLLCAKGYEVQTAADVAAALECTKHADFGLLISDMGLPDGSGLDVIRALRASGKPTKAIAVSGYGTEDDIRRSREAGFAEHLVKPVSFLQLQAAIKRVAG